MKRAADAAKIGGVLLAVLVLPLAVANYAFYSRLHVSPFALGVSYQDLATRGLPGLVIVLVATVGLVLLIYGGFIVMNVLASPFVFRRWRKASAVGIAVTLAGPPFISAVHPSSSSASWPFCVGLTLWFLTGVAVVRERRWRAFASGVLVASPLGPPVLLIVGLGTALLMRHSGDFQDPKPSTVVWLGMDLLLLVLSFGFMTLPTALLYSEEPAAVGRAWSTARSVATLLTLRRCLGFFLILTFVYAVSLICAASVYAGNAFRNGVKVSWLRPSSVVEPILESTYGLSGSCVQLASSENPFDLPLRAVLLNSRKADTYAMVWPDHRVHFIPSNSVRVTETDAAYCLTS